MAPSSETEPNPYELLGISQEATETEIRSAYRARSLKVHPDRVRLFQFTSHPALLTNHRIEMTQMQVSLEYIHGRSIHCLNRFFQLANSMSSPMHRTSYLILSVASPSTHSSDLQRQRKHAFQHTMSNGRISSPNSKSENGNSRERVWRRREREQPRRARMTA